MAPRIARSRGDTRASGKDDGEVARRAQELRRKVEESCDYVGERFAEEARRIHYGECKPRDIYGEASASEAEALREEGVSFQSLPTLPRANS